MVDNPFSPEAKARQKRKEELECLTEDELIDIILKKEGFKKMQFY